MASRIINRTARIGGITAASLLSLSSTVPSFIRSSTPSSSLFSSVLRTRIQYMATGKTVTDYISLDETSQNVDDIIKSNSKVIAYYTAA